jgi:site-specific recombinase XerD
LGRRRRDGSFPDAGGPLSTGALIRIVRPIMLKAGVPTEQAHPQTLRHTFGRLYMAAPRAELSRLQPIMGHASPETTCRYGTTTTTSWLSSTALRPRRARIHLRQR